ncbi:hypothetical protein KR018_007958 [Drosophila ironensis]|nr:hypothetical protein KR018_007958 [Drosophila ironensis]
MKYPLLLLGSLSLAHGLALYATTYPFVYTAEGSAVFTPTQRQYITQDQLGQYSYGYSEPLSSKQETRTLDGTTFGTYSYRDALGKLQTVEYRADAGGFHVAATNLPKNVLPLPQDGISPRSSSHSHPVDHGVSHPVAQPTVVESGRSVEHHDHQLPHPVDDTDEVAAAKSLHLKQVEDEKVRNQVLAKVPVARSSHHVLVPAPVYGYPVPRYYAPGVYY